MMICFALPLSSPPSPSTPLSLSVLFLPLYLYYYDAFSKYCWSSFAPVTMHRVCQTPRNILGTTPLNRPAGPCSFTTIEKIPGMERWGCPALALAWASMRASSECLFVLVFFFCVGEEAKVKRFLFLKPISPLSLLFFFFFSLSPNTTTPHRWGGSSTPARPRRCLPRPPGAWRAWPWGRRGRACPPAPGPTR